LLALAADGLALAGGKGGQEVVKRRVTGIEPVELLVCALQETALAERTPFRLSQKGDMGRRQLAGGGDFGQRIAERATDFICQRTGAGQQSRASHRRERHGHLEFGIVIAAGALESLRPALVEDVFALRVGLHVTGCGTQEVATGVLGQKVAHLPAGSGADRF
jgi:hypothetical protein